MALGFKENKPDKDKEILAASFEEFLNANRDKKLIWIGERHDKHKLTKQFVERLVDNLLANEKRVVLLAEKKNPGLLEGRNAYAWLDKLSRSKDVLLEDIDDINASGKERNAHMQKLINDSIEKYGGGESTVFIVITGKRHLVKISGEGFLEEEIDDAYISKGIAIKPQDAVGVFLDKDTSGKVECPFDVWLIKNNPYLFVVLLKNSLRL